MGRWHVDGGMGVGEEANGRDAAVKGADTDTPRAGSIGGVEPMAVDPIADEGGASTSEPEGQMGRVQVGAAVVDDGAEVRRMEAHACGGPKRGNRNARRRRKRKELNAMGAPPNPRTEQLAETTAAKA